MDYIKKIINIILFLVLINSVSCNSNNNDNIIPKEEFIKILSEIHFYDAVLTERGLYDRKLKDSTESYYNYVLKKYNMSRSRFDSSLNYYAYDLESFDKMYDQVIENIKYKSNQFKIRKSIFNIPTRVLDSIASSKKHNQRVARKREIWTKKKNWSLPKDGKLNIIKLEKKIYGQSTFELSASYKVYPDDKTVNLTMVIYIYYSDGTKNTALFRDFVKDGKWHTHKITAKTIAGKIPVKIIIPLASHGPGTVFKHLEIKNISLKQQPIINLPMKNAKKKSKEIDQIKNNIKIIKKPTK